MGILGVSDFPFRLLETILWLRVALVPVAALPGTTYPSDD